MGLINYFKEYWIMRWDESENKLEKILFICELPITILRKSTVPVPYPDEYYCRPLIGLSFILSPIWICIYLKEMHDTNFFDNNNDNRISWYYILQSIAILIGLLIIRLAPSTTTKKGDNNDNEGSNTT